VIRVFFFADEKPKYVFLLVEAGPGNLKLTIMSAVERQKHVLWRLGNQICDNPTRQSLDGDRDFSPGDEGAIEDGTYHNPDTHGNEN